MVLVYALAQLIWIVKKFKVMLHKRRLDWIRNDDGELQRDFFFYLAVALIGSPRGAAGGPDPNAKG